MSRYLKSCEFELLNFLERNPNNSLDAAGRAKYYQTVANLCFFCATRISLRRKSSTKLFSLSWVVPRAGDLGEP